MAAADRLRITEIFHSIQGESTHAGRPSYFVRLTGCNLRCVWCDSEYTFSGGDWMSFDEIFAALDALPACDLVEVTGGEPMLQKNVIPFMQACLDRGLEVMLETGGSLDLSEVPAEVRKIVDLKPPASGEVAANLWSNLALLQPWDEVKCVIASRGDYEWARERVAEHGLLAKHTVLFSPVFGDLEPVELAQWILADGLPIRMQLQMHKFIWDPAARGV
jgi:7-carboxy-7-deazaguanine synthase